MIKTRHFLAGIILFFCIQACTERAICPAYQSAFIHDDDVLKRHFSYFREDSTPRIMEASKDRFLIIEPVAYRKKLRSLRTIPMRDVYPQKEEEKFDDDFYLAEREGYDSTAVISSDTIAAADSVYVISLKKEKFNIDQELYLWYLRDHLVYPDVRLMRQQNLDKKTGDRREGRTKKGFSGFFKSLFKKKDKSDSTIFDVETTATELDQGEKREKKGLFNFLKKQNKKEEPKKEEDDPIEPAPAPAEPPAEKQDDGLDDF